MTETSQADIAALETLASEIDPGEYSTAIVCHGGVPCLRVASLQAPQLAEDIYAGRGWFWWSWAERLTPCEEPAAAAAKVARVLRAVPEPAS